MVVSSGMSVLSKNICEKNISGNEGEKTEVEKFFERVKFSDEFERVKE